MASWLNKMARALHSSSSQSPSSPTEEHGNSDEVDSEEENMPVSSSQRNTAGSRSNQHRSSLPVSSGSSSRRAVQNTHDRRSAHGTRGAPSSGRNALPVLPRSPIRPEFSTPRVELGPESTPAIPDSLFYASNFLLGVGMLIIQPATGKVVVVHDARAPGHYFFPKGRKDVGESLEQAVVREAYEEVSVSSFLWGSLPHSTQSGYRATLMPLISPTQAPPSPEDTRSFPLNQLNTEPIYMSSYYWSPSRRREQGGIYFTFWYVGEIPHDAVSASYTGSHLTTSHLHPACRNTIPELACPTNSTMYHNLWITMKRCLNCVFLMRTYSELDITCGRGETRPSKSCSALLPSMQAQKVNI